MGRRNLLWILLLVCACLGVLSSGCAKGSTFGIEEGPKPSSQSVRKLNTIALSQMSPEYPPSADLSHKDLREMDLRDRLDDLLSCTFDSRTRWPRQLPTGFDPAAVLSEGKDPGLGLKALHKNGLNGKGVGIGIIDQNLLVGHSEYKDRLRLYKEIDIDPKEEASVHGAAVASIAVGKTVGVAPAADLYYIAAPQAGRDFSRIADCVDDLLNLNESLPADEKIRVISISMGPKPHETGYADIIDAIRRAEESGVFVITCSLEETHGLQFHGLGRFPLSDPNELRSYTAGSWWDAEPDLLPNAETLLVPMDSRTVASPTGNKDFTFYRFGGWSWSAPYIAGLYALGCQVDPDMTPSLFWEAALETGAPFSGTTPGGTPVQGIVVNPAALLESLAE